MENFCKQTLSQHALHLEEETFPRLFETVFEALFHSLLLFNSLIGQSPIH
jgi:hypothetical protein